MASKNLGLGTLVKVDEDDDGNTPTTCTLIIDATPPGRKRVRVDGTSLSDTLSTYAPGIEDYSEFMFTQFWDADDTQHKSIDTLFGSGGIVEWTLVFADTVTWEFEGWVSDLEPQTVVKDQHIQRKVTIQRTSAITQTDAGS